ncbi:DUF397 domain-containing protein [Streptomyces noursei]
MAPGFPGVVLKDPCGAVLVVPADGWSSFVAAVKGGELTA